MRAIASTYGRVLVLLLVVIAVTASGTTAAVASDTERTDAKTSVLTGSAVTDRLPADNDCDGAAVSDAEIDEREERIVYGYVEGFEDGRVQQWTDGSVRRFGASGDCTLSLRDGTAQLTGAQLNPSTGALRATIDLGRGGAFLLTPEDDSDVSIAVENVGYENNDTVRVVTTDATGSTDQFQLTAPSGRFFDLRLQFTGEDTARVALSEIDFGYPEETDWEPIELAPQNESWAITLESRAYLDEIAVGDRQLDDESDDSTATAPDGGSDDSGDAQSDRFDRFDDDQSDEFDPYEESRETAGGTRSGSPGLFLGPILALVGAGIARFAYGITRFNEQLDAFGSTTPSHEVEPAGWNVVLTKLFGILLSIGSAVWFLGELVTTL